MSTKNVIRKRTCRTCGVVFDGGPRAWYCPDCRAERRRRSDKKSKLNKKAGKNIQIGVTTKLCQVCGKPFTVMSARQKYCKVCAVKAIRAIDREQSRGWIKRAVDKYGAGYISERNAKKRKPLFKKECVICHKPFMTNIDKVLTCSDKCRKVYTRFSQSKAKTFEEWQKQQKISAHNYGLSYIKSTGNWQLTLHGKYVGVYKMKREAITIRNKMQDKKREMSININSVLTTKEAADLLNITIGAAQQLYKGVPACRSRTAVPPRLRHDEYRKSSGIYLIASAGISRVYNIDIPFSENSKESLKNVFCLREAASIYKVSYQVLAFYCRTGELSNIECRKTSNAWLITRQAMERMSLIMPIGEKSDINKCNPVSTLSINVRTNDKERWKQAAAAQGKSLRNFISDIINDNIRKYKYERENK